MEIIRVLKGIYSTQKPVGLEYVAVCNPQGEGREGGGTLRAEVRPGPTRTDG